MTYTPKVNDYVIWKNGVEGWIYFKDKQYITIELEESVRPKDEFNYQCCSLHKNERVLVVCYPEQWKELTYVRSRESKYEEEKNLVETVGEIDWGESDEK
jgi:hypothetical protein